MVGDKDCRGNFMRHPAGVPGFISVRNKARVLCSLWSCWVFAVKFSRCGGVGEKKFLWRSVLCCPALGCAGIFFTFVLGSN